MPIPGYVYALVNASMPGLVKVGRTERDPKDRATELSGATGVATPFLVVYQEYFSDSEYAESWIHESLQQQGYRVSPNREFFNAEIVDVIKTICACECKATPGEMVPDPDDEDLLSRENDELSELRLDGYEPLSPADELFEQADNYYYGLDGELQDYGEAMRLYKQAARLGSSDAFLRIAGMFENGEGVRENLNTALDYYKEGARKGNYYSYANMAGIFFQLRHEENHKKCWDKFFLEAGDGSKAFRSRRGCLIICLTWFIWQHVQHGWPIVQVPQLIIANKQALLAYAHDDNPSDRSQLAMKYPSNAQEMMEIDRKNRQRVSEFVRTRM